MAETSINTDYVNWLVQFIKNGTINMKTNKPFIIDDIKLQEYKDAVISKFKQEVINKTITSEQYKTITGIDYTV